MSPDIALVFWGLVLLEVKHFVCDFVVQTAYQYRNKGIYGHPGGFVHAGLHAAGSIPALLLLTDKTWLVAAIFVSEFVIHYHVDWLKEQINKRYALTVDEAVFWMVLGFDQLIHQMTYVGILALLVNNAHL